ncbi:MAG: cob(I)yrinic acid a,c-diamide adenosyltransferase [Muribaculaceae bacterium]|nr:cob(I)yrinic acid a,c-diamide adenosyltransferase [Muribaculaceae bacterium]
MKSNLYTRTGDNGSTSLVGGERISKICPRLEAYGTLDEFSSFLGVVLSEPSCPGFLKDQLLQIQNSLFDAGCYLATAVAPGTTPRCNGLSEASISEVEEWIDSLDSQTPKIRAFVLPGGSMPAAHCHVARAVCRRAERCILKLGAEEYVDPTLLRWINRLSDYLFIAARYLNHEAGIDEIIWRPADK